MSQNAVLKKDQAISLSAAAREAQGKATYRQLYAMVKRGKLRVTQPYGKHGHYRVERAELERILSEYVPPEPN